MVVVLVMVVVVVVMVTVVVMVVHDDGGGDDGGHGTGGDGDYDDTIVKILKSHTRILHNFDKNRPFHLCVSVALSNPHRLLFDHSTRETPRYRA